LAKFNSIDSSVVNPNLRALYVTECFMDLIYPKHYKPHLYAPNVMIDHIETDETSE